MFNIFKKKPTGTMETLKVKGMHCASCAITINGALEDTVGIISADTNFAKSEIKVEFNPDKVDLDAIKNIVLQLGYDIF